MAQHPELTCEAKLEKAHISLVYHGRGSMAEMILATDLNESKKLYLMDAAERMLTSRRKSKRERCGALSLLGMQIVMATFVPILIPFGLKYYGRDDIITDDFGTLLLILAVCCSLLGSLAMALERCCKYQAVAYGGYSIVAEMEMEIQTFLALAGVYGGYSSHKQGFKHFAARLAIMENARHQLENDTMGGAEARSDQGKVKQPGSLLGAASVVAVSPEDPSGPSDAIRAFDDDDDDGDGYGKANIGKSDELELREAESVVDILDEEEEHDEAPSPGPPTTGDAKNKTNKTNKTDKSPNGK